MDKEIVYFKLDGITRVFNLLGYISNINFEIENIDFNNKKYSIKKDKDTFIISSSDNRLLRLKMEFEEAPSKDYTDRSNAIIEYYFPDNTVLKLRNRIGDSISYDNFKTFESSNLADEPYIKYYILDKKNETVVSYGLDYFEYKNAIFTFTSKGIEYYNEYLVSRNGERLLSIEDTKCLTLEEVKAFNYKNEKAKIISLLESNNSLHPYSKMIIKEALSNLKWKEKEAKDIIIFYKEDIPLCKELVNLRKSIINNLKKYTFTKDELLFIIEIINKVFGNQQEDNKTQKLIK